MDKMIIKIDEIDKVKIKDSREVVTKDVPISPPLENLVVTPSSEEQVFNHENSYGYDEVRVGAVQGKSLEVIPSNEEQTFSDLYTNVKVQGDEDLLATNIKQGVEIFGVTGSLEEMTIETKEGINNQEEIITNQETTLEEINQVINDKILVKEKFKPRYLYNPISFRNYTGTELGHEISMLDTTYFTNMSGMFQYCCNLTTLDLSGWETSNTTDMYQMFYYCDKLTNLDLSSFNTSKVTKMSSMFGWCLNLTELTLSNFDTAKVTAIDSMFQYCRKLTFLDLSSFDTSNITSMKQMFLDCQKLEHLDIRNFTFDKVTNYTNMFVSVPNDCLIIVKSETEKQWLTSRFSNLTNVKTVAELEG